MMHQKVLGPCLADSGAFVHCDFPSTEEWWVDEAGWYTAISRSPTSSLRIAQPYHSCPLAALTFVLCRTPSPPCLFLAPSPVPILPGPQGLAPAPPPPGVLLTSPFCISSFSLVVTLGSPVPPGKPGAPCPLGPPPLSRQHQLWLGSRRDGWLCRLSTRL